LLDEAATDRTCLQKQRSSSSSNIADDVGSLAQIAEQLPATYVFAAAAHMQQQQLT
jgi:hypothetical protein